MVPDLHVITKMSVPRCQYQEKEHLWREADFDE